MHFVQANIAQYSINRYKHVTENKWQKRTLERSKKKKNVERQYNFCTMLYVCQVSVGLPCPTKSLQPCLHLRSTLQAFCCCE